MRTHSPEHVVETDQLTGYPLDRNGRTIPVAQREVSAQLMRVRKPTREELLERLERQQDTFAFMAKEGRQVDDYIG
jgi:hypothetical protein